jgi:hypothetical protein
LKKKKRRELGSYDRYNNELIAKLLSIFTDVEERGGERENSLTLMQATSWVRNHRHLKTQIKVYVRRNRKEKVRHGAI